LLAEPPEAALCIRGFDEFVTSLAAPIATGWSESCRVGFAPTEDRRLSRRTRYSRLVTVTRRRQSDRYRRLVTVGRRPLHRFYRFVSVTRTCQAHRFCRLVTVAAPTRRLRV